MATPSLLSRLQAVTDGLTYPSESDEPVLPFVRPGAKGDEADLRKQAGVDAGTSCETPSPAAFFQRITNVGEAHDAGEKARMQRFRDLEALLKKELTDVRVYVFGDVERDIVIAGRTPEGDLAGITTKSVET